MRYDFNKAIEEKLNLFESYMKSKKYSVDTIRQNRNYSGIYLEWLEREEMSIEEVDYKAYTDFVFYLKDTGTKERNKENSPNLTRRIILATRHYYSSLEINKNPASGIYIRGKRRSILNHIVPYRELIELYDVYETLDDRDKRNKVVLGLIIYQGITTGELHSLEPSHIKLKEEKIYIPGRGNTNRRILALKAAQLLDLQEYLLNVRPRMLQRIKEYEKTPNKIHRSGRRPDEINPIIYDKLFFSENGNEHIKSSLHHMFRRVKKRNPKVTSGKIIRSTVIAEWLKTKDLRIVQYMAGHRWVSSTEKYNVYNLEELKEALNKHHPLR